MRRHSHLLEALSIVAIAVGLYANALRGSFQFDDATSILENDALRSPDPLRWWAFWPGRLVSYTTLGIDWHLHGLNPLGYHLTNVVLHAMAGLVVLWWARQLTRQSAPQRSAAFVAWTAAAIFVSHPLQTQAVAYITQRMAVLVALFYVSAVALHLQGMPARAPADEPSDTAGGNSRWARWLGPACGLLAVLSKEPALTLPLMVYAADATVQPAPRGRWRRVLPYVPLLLVPLLAATLGGGRFGRDEPTLTGQTTLVSHATYLRTELGVLARYLRLLVFPVGQNIDHDVPWQHSWQSGQVVLPALLHLALAVVGILSWRRGARLLGLAIAWWYVTLLPESSLFPITDAMVEHRLYAAMPAFALAVAWLLEPLWRRHRRVAVATVFVMVAALGTLTVERNRVWHDPYALWRDAVVKSPQKGRPYAALGWLHNKAGRYPLAVERLEQSVALDAHDPQAWNNLGLACEGVGDHARAAEAFRRAAELRPRETTLWLNLASAQQNRGDLVATAESLERCLQLDRRNADALLRLAALRMNDGRLDEAAALAQEAATLGGDVAALQAELARRRGGKSP